MMNANSPAVPMAYIRGLSLDQLNLRSRVVPAFNSPKIQVDSQSDQYPMYEQRFPHF